MTKYFTYDGSFTTPPCTEGVKWTVIADMCTIPKKLLARFMAYESMKGNYRHAQALNGRKTDGELSTTKAPIQIWYPSDNVAWSLFPESRVCATGLEQSPIDLPELSRAKLRDLIDPMFNPIRAMVKDTGHGLKWELEDGEGKTILEKPKLFNALQFHIHTGAEHTIAGTRPDIEFHFVHQAEDGTYGVLGIMCNAGDSNILFWNQLEASLSKETTIDAESLFASVDMTKYFTYDGSFTTPPCTEGVKWTVIADMCTIPKKLLARFMAYESMKGNYRHAQALNGRKIDGELPKDKNIKLAVPQWYPSDNFGWSLFPDSKVCLTGMAQSPIDLPALSRAKYRTLIDPVFRPIEAMAKDTGHGLKWELEQGEGETILDHPKLFNALQFHIHTGAEHTVTGIRSDIEFHFVHQAEDGTYGVLGIMCNSGDSDLLFWNQLETSLTEETTIDAESLFASVDMTKYFTYDGSFTTPPCTEGVKWTVIADMCTIPTKLLKEFSKYKSMKGNYRHRQPLNGRNIGGIFSPTDIVVEDEDIALMYDEIAFDLDYDYYPMMEDTSRSISKSTHHLASPAVLIIIFFAFAFLFCTFQVYKVYKRRTESTGNIQTNGLTAPLIDEDFSLSDIDAESPDPLSQI